MAAGLYDITNEILGKGHFAIVKLAKHCLTGEHVAIKIIDKSKLNKENLEQLKHEISLWSILSEHEHPNIVKLYQCIDTRTKLYLVMEYCGGQVCDLFDYLQKRNDGNGLDEDEALAIFRQVCNAILYCHSLRIVHRDLKPENILIVNNTSAIDDVAESEEDDADGGIFMKKKTVHPQPVVKLIDFGFSSQWVEDEMLKTSCGSLAYSAPEILLGKQYFGPKVDVWSLGCILYILLFGRNPFMQFNDNETLTKILDCSFTIPNKEMSNSNAIDLIKNLLQVDPARRLSIEKIMQHPWLESNPCSQASSSSSTPMRSASIAANNSKKNYLDHIIDQMIVQGIHLPKEHIHMILKNEVQQIEARSDEDALANNLRHEDRRVNDHHYIKATYHLLKDKSIRECKGINVNSNYTKRGNILKKANFRRSFDQPALMDEAKPKRATAMEIRAANLRNKAAAANDSSLDVPQDGGNSFALPLARKCSIVSEEGSVCNEHNSFTESSLTPEVIPERRESDPSERKPINYNRDGNDFPVVNIFVTDSSSSQNLATSSNFCDYKSGRAGLEPISAPLHPVSSSPDFLNTFKLDEEEEEQGNAVLAVSTRKGANSGQAEHGHRRGSDIFREEFDKLSHSRASPMPMSNSPRLGVSVISNNSPSVRVIVQSKSMNNITLAERKGGDHKNAGLNTSNDSRTAKMANSISSVNIKHSRQDKADCCAIQ